VVPNTEAHVLIPTRRARLSQSPQTTTREQQEGAWTEVILAPRAVALRVALDLSLMPPLSLIPKPKALTVELVALVWQQIRAPLSRTEKRK
jgi:hypothetical protein